VSPGSAGLAADCQKRHPRANQTAKAIQARAITAVMADDDSPERSIWKRVRLPWRDYAAAGMTSFA
jgi:hypothetical protein